MVENRSDAMDLPIGSVLCLAVAVYSPDWWHSCLIRVKTGWRRLKGSRYMGESIEWGAGWEEVNTSTGLPDDISHPGFTYLSRCTGAEEGEGWLEHWRRNQEKPVEALWNEWYIAETFEDGLEATLKPGGTRMPEKTEDMALMERMKDAGARTLGDFKLGGVFGTSQAISDEVVNYFYPLVKDAFPAGTPETAIRQAIAIGAPVFLRVVLTAAPLNVPGRETIDKGLGMAITMASADSMRQLLSLVMPLFHKIMVLMTEEAQTAMLGLSMEAEAVKLKANAA